MNNDFIKKTKIGMLWNVFEKIVVQGISFILNIILARLLSPHDYGTIGMLTIFLMFSNVFIDSGFSRALIQKQDRTENDFSTALIFNISVSVILYVMLYVLSPAIASFYKTPELILLQRIFFVVIILNSLIVVQSAQLQIIVDFKKIALINFVSMIVSGTAGIFTAYHGFGAWSLVIQTLTKSFTAAVLFWVFGQWLPHTGFSRNSFRRLFSFGSKLLISGTLATFLQNINNLVIGKIYSPANLGYYTRALQFPELTSGTLSSVLNNATFPLMSSLQDDRLKLIQNFEKLIKVTSLLVFPAMTGLALLSEEIILVLLGAKWLPAANLLFWLSLSYIFTPLSMLNMNILNAIGRSDLFLKVDICKVPVILLVMVITFPISLEAVVIGKFAASFIYFYINGFIPGRMFNFGSLQQLHSSWKYILSTFIMMCIIIIIKKIIDSVFLCLLFATIGGIIIYFLVLYILHESYIITSWRKMKIFFHLRIYPES